MNNININNLFSKLGIPGIDSNTGSPDLHAGFTISRFGTLKDKSKIDFNDDEFILSISNASNQLAVDMEQWIDSWYKNPISTICCVIRFFVTLSTNIDGLLLLAAIGYSLDSLAKESTIDFFQLLKKLLDFSILGTIDLLLSKLKQAILKFIEWLLRPMANSKLMEECFHISMVLAAIKKWLNSILDLHVSISASLSGILGEEVGWKSKIKMNLNAESLKYLAYLPKLLSAIGLGALSKIEEYDICNLVQIESKIPGLGNLLTEAFNDIDNEDSIWWEDYITTDVGKFRTPSDQFINELEDVMVRGIYVVAPQNSGLRYHLQEARYQIGHGDKALLGMEDIVLDYLIDPENGCMSDTGLKDILSNLFKK